MICKGGFEGGRSERVLGCKPKCMTVHVKGFQKKHNERVDISILKSTNMSQMVMCKN